MTPFKTGISTCPICCNSFESLKQKELITIYSLPKSLSKKEDLAQSKILFIVNGEGSLYFEKSREINLKEGSFLILPIGSNYTLEADTDIFFCEFVIDEIISLTDIAVYYQGVRSRSGKFAPYVLSMNEKVWMYLTTTIDFINDGLGCKCYHKIKIREFLHVLRVYFQAEELQRFFQPLRSKTVRFAMTVYENWDKVKTLSELAEMVELSLSGFSKKFRRIFGLSPYQWIMDKRGERIIEELGKGEKSIKQLTEEFEFNSVQHFGYYCKKRFGYSPGKIRQMFKKRENSG
ncbi:MAG: AraC family transcriptional regulator [Alistipes sp.]|nr:AraC family transcriptional regulator [Alistipes sp.]